MWNALHEGAMIQATSTLETELGTLHIAKSYGYQDRIGALIDGELVAVGTYERGPLGRLIRSRLARSKGIAARVLDRQLERGALIVWEVDRDASDLVASGEGLAPESMLETAVGLLVVEMLEAIDEDALVGEARERYLGTAAWYGRDRRPNHQVVASSTFHDESTLRSMLGPLHVLGGVGLDCLLGELGYREANPLAATVECVYDARTGRPPTARLVGTDPLEGGWMIPSCRAPSVPMARIAQSQGLRAATDATEEAVVELVCGETTYRADLGLLFAPDLTLRRSTGEAVAVDAVLTARELDVDLWSLVGGASGGDGLLEAIVPCDAGQAADRLTTDRTFAARLEAAVWRRAGESEGCVLERDPYLYQNRMSGRASFRAALVHALDAPGAAAGEAAEEGEEVDPEAARSVDTRLDELGGREPDGPISIDRALRQAATFVEGGESLIALLEAAGLASERAAELEEALAAMDASIQDLRFGDFTPTASRAA